MDTLGAAAFARLGVELLDGLHAVHMAGLLHRDVKPSNIVYAKSGVAKLADFGIAHLPGFETTVEAEGARLAGTIRYMSPEVAKGRRPTVTSDLWAAAATLYEAWEARPYLEVQPDESAIELQMRVASMGEFPPAWNGPAALRGFFQRALHPVPEHRFQTARAMRTAFSAAVRRAPRSLRPRPVRLVKDRAVEQTP